MKTKNIKLKLLAVLFVAVAACKPEIDAPKATKGDADFSKYIAVGNSLTAGFADGGLYLAGQKVAYPNLIAEKMKLVGGGDFTSPFFTTAQENGSGYIRLAGFNADGTPITAQDTTKLAYREPGKLTKYTDEVQNLGIPGMRLDLGVGLAAFSQSNMYFERLLPAGEEGTKTYLDFVEGRNHTFFSFWLGNNDALGWATNGGVQEPGLGALTTTLTSTTAFNAAYDEFINALTANGAKGVVATIPDVTSVPFFNTVTVAAINAALGANTQLPATNRKLIIETGAGAKREATSEDLIVLTFDRSKLDAALYGVSTDKPMENKYVLDKDEIATVQQRVKDFNTKIKNVAETKNLAFVDAYTILNSVKTPKNYDGTLVSSAFITGNLFSLDGIHLTPIGNALMANEFIKAINAKYNSTIPTVAVSNYIGVKFP